MGDLLVRVMGREAQLLCHVVFVLVVAPIHFANIDTEIHRHDDEEQHDQAAEFSHPAPPDHHWLCIPSTMSLTICRNACRLPSASARSLYSPSARFPFASNRTLPFD